MDLDGFEGLVGLNLLIDSRNNSPADSRTGSRTGPGTVWEKGMRALQLVKMRATSRFADGTEY